MDGRYVDVAVDGPPAFLNLFTYHVPARLLVSVGSMVLVPFGRRQVLGVVFRRSAVPSIPDPRDVISTVGDSPIMSAAQVATAGWVSYHYRCPPYQAASLFFSVETTHRIQTLVRATDSILEPTDETERNVLAKLRAGGPQTLEKLSRRFPADDVASAVHRLKSSGLATSSFTAARHSPVTADAVAVLTRMPAHISKPGSARAAILQALEQGEASLSGLRAVAPGAPAALRALVKEGVVSIRENGPAEKPAMQPGPALTPDQERTWAELRPAIGQGGVFLLHGVTGSGKTEIYLRALEEVIRQGKQGIVLVPEISLTPQAEQRFSARFPGRVVVLHSRMSEVERRRRWQRVREGQADVVVGSRSALFAPLPSLGVIVLDEEHDWSYKQTEPPRYHARDTAIELGKHTGATVILGSATPDAGTYQAALDGEIRLLSLPSRARGGQLPPVRVVDMRAELRAGNRSMFSRVLRDALAGTLARGEQAILYLNHRGSASVVLCRDCGYTARCRRCDTVLTYHASEDKLVCHLCNARRANPASCPECGSRRIRYIGLGTESIAHETTALFPEARVLRLDSDVAHGRAEQDKVLDRFAAGEADILVGTQLVAKGLDVSGVTLVGVVNADIGLFLPDFRAGERVFQQLMQAAGRAGRGGLGLAVIQTYSPGHYVIQAAASHDYSAFFRQEIAHRAEQQYPPFSQLGRLLFSHYSDEKAMHEAEMLAARLDDLRQTTGADIDLFGPAPAYHRIVRNRYRWQIIVRGSDVSKFLAAAAIPTRWEVDIDPQSLL